MMADIYRNARTVLVWLGASVEDIAKAIAYCRRAICVPLKHTKRLPFPTPPERSRWQVLLGRFYPQLNVKRMLEDGKCTRVVL